MQIHFDNNGRNIDIPVLRVMNAAHYLVAYMFETTCSGDQTEYDTLAYASVGRDKQLTFLTMVVLAAMLKRTGGFRARNCRNLILENRSEDFDEGVTLYERFLQSSEEHFAEEDFLIDIPSVAAQLREKDELIAQQTRQITTLENTITTMEEKYQQINIGTQNNISTQNNYNITYAVTPTDVPHYAAEPTSAPQIELFRFIHPSITDEAERLKIHREIENLVRTLPLPEICRYLMEMRKNNRVYLTVKPELMFEELHRLGMPDETKPGFSMKNFRSYFNVND
ncbi:MAG: hypothetical protein IJQ84_05135 [Paludibacteraceae bacterium]|nr:hypothetical protein [Paludibacteraceae bacterium]